MAPADELRGTHPAHDPRGPRAARTLMQLGGYFREHRFYESKTAVTAYRLARRIASALGFQVVLKTFYSPIPDVDALPRDIFARRSDLAGIDFDLDNQAEFVRDRLGPAMAEFRPPARTAAGAPRSYVSENPSYSLLDATVLYGMVRSLRPRHVIELGSGYSTLVTAQAGLANAAEGHRLELEVYDPY